MGDIPLPLDERIRLRAIELWKAEGEPHNRHNEFWELARAQIIEEDLHLPPKPSKP